MSWNNDQCNKSVCLRVPQITSPRQPPTPPASTFDSESDADFNLTRLTFTGIFLCVCLGDVGGLRMRGDGRR